jgi:hypothetical protein
LAAGERAGVAAVEFALSETTAGDAGRPGHVIGSLTISVALAATTAAAAIPALQYIAFFESIVLDR